MWSLRPSYGARLAAVPRSNLDTIEAREAGSGAHQQSEIEAIVLCMS